MFDLAMVLVSSRERPEALQVGVLEHVPLALGVVLCPPKCSNQIAFRAERLAFAASTPEIMESLVVATSAMSKQSLRIAAQTSYACPTVDV